MTAVYAQRDDDDGETKSVVQRAHACYRASKTKTAEWREEAREMFDMAAGHQWSDEEMGQLEDQERAPTVFNRIARTLNAIIGTQINNRQQVTYFPREMGDVQKNEVYSSAAEWVRQECNAEDEETDSFEDMCTCGMGWTDTRMDYLVDPDGMPVVERIDPVEMYWDPSATKRNLTDSRWFLHVKPMSVEEFEQEFPDAELESFSDPWDAIGDDKGGVRDHVYPQDAYKHGQPAVSRGEAVVRVGRYQWVERETFYRVGPEAEEISAENFKKIERHVKEIGLQFVKMERPRWRQAFVAGGKLLSEEEMDCPYPDGSTFRAMTYKRDRNRNTWYGVVRAMRDPQKFGNKFFSQILDILAKNSKGGVMAESDAVDNPDEIEDKWARPDAVHWFRPGAISGGKVMPKPMAEFPAGMDRLMTFSLEGVHEVTGVNLELLGMANRQQAGVLEHQRKQAGVTIIAPLFDSLRRYRKEQGKVLLYFIDNYISDGRLVRVVGQDREKYVPLIREPGSRKFDVVVDEAPTSPSMKDKVFGILQEILPAMLKIGMPVPPDVLDYMPLPSSLTAKWKEMITQSGGNPAAMQERIAKGDEEIKRLTAENAQLKDKSAAAAAGMQLDREKAVADTEAKRIELELNIEKTESELALKREELEIDKQKALAEIALKEKSASVDADLQREASRNKMEIHKTEVAEKRRAGEPDEHVSALLSKVEAMGKELEESRKAKGPKRRMVRIVRDAKTGDMVGAEVEDGEAA